MSFQKFVDECKNLLKGFDKSPILELPPKEIEADLAYPCFNLAKKQNKNPSDIAKELEEKLKKNIKKNSLLNGIKSIGPYLNFYINNEKFSEIVINDILNKRKKYGSEDIGKKKIIVIDYSSPNIAKPMNIGHLRSTIIGQALYNIYNFLGYRCIGDNHLGDWGTQFGKLIYAYKNWGSKEKIKKDPIKEMLELYVRFHKESEKNPQLNEEGRRWFKKLENGDKESVKIWKWFKDLSIKEFNKIYKRLNIKFDYMFGESFYNSMLQEIVKEALDKGIAIWGKTEEGKKETIVEEEIKEKEKVILVPLEKYGIDTPLLIQKSDGTSLYATRDLATAKYRIKKWNPEQIIYVVGSEQQLYFRQWFKVLELLGYKTKCVHVWFGLVRLPEGRLSTRIGRVIFLEDVINKTVELAKKTIEEKNPKLKNKKKVAEMVGIGAIKYNDLSRDRIRDIVFDWNQMLNFEGDTGPYLQYTHARACSILRKSKKKPKTDKLTEKKEFEIIKKMSQFSDVIKKSAEDYKPHYLANYLFDLATMFNEYYHTTRIIDSDNEEARLALVKAITIVLKNGLNLLGIEAPEEM